MSHKTLIGGTAYEISGGNALIAGTSYEVSGGRTLIGGTGYDVSFAAPDLVIYAAGDTALEDGTVYSKDAAVAFQSQYLYFPAGSFRIIIRLPDITEHRYLLLDCANSQGTYGYGGFFSGIADNTYHADNESFLNSANFVNNSVNIVHKGFDLSSYPTTQAYMLRSSSYKVYCYGIRLSNNADGYSILE